MARVVAMATARHRRAAATDKKGPKESAASTGGPSHRPVGGETPSSVAVLNVGSTSVKAAIAYVRGTDGEVRWRDQVQKSAGETRSAVARALDLIEREVPAVNAFGHRVVHGGTRYTAPTLIDPDLEQAIVKVAPLSRLLNLGALEGIRAARRRFPRVPHVAVFDTAFHAHRPLDSIHYPLPRNLTDALAIYRYGFHGLAHRSLVESLARAEGRDVSEVSALTLQLGATCSACAVQNGRSIETSMGFTPLEGLPGVMGAGTIDPAIVLHLTARKHSLDRIEESLTRRAGLLGLGGTDSVEELVERAGNGEERAGLALGVFTRRTAMTAGGYLTLLNGHGALVFGGGIGFGSAEIRTRIAAQLSAWDVRLDPERNEAGGPGLVSAAGGREVYVFETDEEAIIARDVSCVLSRAPVA